MDKSDNRVVYRHEPNFVTAPAWYGLVCKANGRARTIHCFLFLEEADVMFYNVFLDVIFYPHMVLGIKNYPSTCMSCYSDDLVLLLLPHLDL